MATKASIVEACEQVGDRKVLRGAVERAGAFSIRNRYERAKAILVKNGVTLTIDGKLFRNIAPSEVMKILKPCVEVLGTDDVLEAGEYAPIRWVLKRINCSSRREVRMPWHMMQKLRRISRKLNDPG